MLNSRQVNNAGIRGLKIDAEGFARLGLKTGKEVIFHKTTFLVFFRMFPMVDGLAEGKVDDVVNEFLQDAKEDLLKKKGWPSVLFAYIIPLAALSAFTRNIARKFPNFRVNVVHPGFVKRNMSYVGQYTLEEGARGPVQHALALAGGPSGQFLFQSELSHF
ncbi:unnamed protein product [Thlaspi arvense]|uniref:Uncharacterized protein n=1 Tax=Thlaspi arvense TaxID=13288 RepID=A0AAU9SXQ2_THLAR|nr:unnamed protein product [Thlaspi arvense]